MEFLRVLNFEVNFEGCLKVPQLRFSAHLIQNLIFYQILKKNYLEEFGLVVLESITGRLVI